MALPRTFPPLYTSTGDAAADQLAFFHILQRLKVMPHFATRFSPEEDSVDTSKNWLGEFRGKISHPESIADHMYRMAVLAMCTSDTSLDIAKCVMMAVVHDIAEAQVGDITPHEGITKEEKHGLETEAIKNFVSDMLHDSPAAKRIEALYQEYEQGETAEARFVKDLDKLEMALQAVEYEREKGPGTLQPFLDSSIPKLRHPEVQSWGATLLANRNKPS